MKWLDLATEIARSNPVHQLSKHAAVLTNGKRVYIGQNSRNFHPLQHRYNPKACIHAEIAAIVAAKRVEADLSDFRMFVARVLRDGSTANSQPCCACQRALRDFNIKKVYHT